MCVCKLWVFWDVMVFGLCLVINHSIMEQMIRVLYSFHVFIISIITRTHEQQIGIKGTQQRLVYQEGFWEKFSFIILNFLYNNTERRKKARPVVSVNKKGPSKLHPNDYCVWVKLHFNLNFNPFFFIFDLLEWLHNWLNGNNRPVKQSASHRCDWGRLFEFVFFYFSLFYYNCPDCSLPLSSLKDTWIHVC